MYLSLQRYSYSESFYGSGPGLADVADEMKLQSVTERYRNTPFFCCCAALWLQHAGIKMSSLESGQDM